MQTRREFLAAAAGAAMPAQADRRPNILVLLPDQLRAHALGCMGDEQARTPHLDRLASQGLVHDNTFANSPVCCPARALMLTGQYCHRNGMVANDLRLSEKSLSFARILRDAGYRTGFVGKWHLDGGKRLPGFVPPGARRQGYEFWVANECSHEHFRNTVFRDTPDPIVLDRFEADGYADYAVEFLDRARGDRRPFYLAVQWGPPHDPYEAPQEYSRRFDASRLKMRPNFRPGHGVEPKHIAEYYAMVNAIDDATGRILKRLDELKLSENTIVLVSSDHGDMLGSQGERLKRKPWEESIKVPGILRWPGRIAAGTRSSRVFTHVDFAPTLLGLAGMAVPKAMQGTNFARAMLGDSVRTPDSAFFQIFGPYAGDGTPAGWRGIRTESYTYARFQDRPWVLYDLKKDPYQLKNLAGDRAAKPLQQELDRRLRGWMESTGDSWRFNWTHPVEDAGRLYRHRTFYTVAEYLEWARQHPELDRSQSPE